MSQRLPRIADVTAELQRDLEQRRIVPLAPAGRVVSDSQKMPIPEFNENGLLPAGVHDCTLAEVAARFGVFQGSEQRPRLMAKLEAFVIEARGAGILREVLVDGSFVTAEPSPNDVDLIIVVASEHDFSADLSPAAYNIVSKRRVRRRYGFDLLVARAGSVEYGRWVEFFQQVRLEPAAIKGILRVQI